MVKNPPAIQETQEIQVQSPNWEDALEKEMATHSSILAWNIPGTAGLSVLHSWGSRKSQTRLTTHGHTNSDIMQSI